MIIKYAFSATGRRVAKILKHVDKDYSKVFRSKFQEIKTEDLTNQYIDVRDTTQQHEHFTKPHNLNKYIKQEFKKEIDQSVQDEVERMRRDEIEDQSLKWTENRIMAEEVRKFEKLLFQKNERLRLLKQEANRVENHLPISYLQQKGEAEYIHLNKLNSQYTNTLKDLHNQRIIEMQQNTSNPYGMLVKSQLLVQYPTVKPLIEKHIAKLPERNVDELIDELKSKVDTTNSIIDWESVKAFYIGMQAHQDNSLIAYSQHQHGVNLIQDHQDYLMDRFYNNSLQLRVKGCIQFEDLTEEECARYIKYDIQTPEILMRLVTTMAEIREKFTGRVASTILQKLVVIKKDYIALLADDRFRLLLNTLSRVEFDDQSLSQTILALSFLQPRKIQTIYDKLSYHLYDNIVSQLIPRIKQLNTSQLSMVCRNLHMTPIAKNIDLQNMLVSEILHNRVNDVLSVYEAESFIQFLSRPIMNYPALATTIYQLMDKMFTLPKARQEIDNDTLTMIASAVVKIQDPKAISTLIKDHVQTLQPAIESCQCKHLAPFTLMLSKLDIHRNHDLVKLTKKRFVDIITLKQKEQDETDIAIIVSSMVQIDTKMMYSIRRVNEILLLQTLYNRLPFPYKSAYHVPYQKLTNILQSYGSMFSEKNLVIILHSLITVGHINKDTMLQTLLQFKDVQYAFPLLVSLNIVDHHLDQFIYKFNQQESTIQGVLFYLQALFHFNRLKIDDFDKVQLDQLDELDQTSKCFMMFLITAVAKCPKGQLIYNKLIRQLNPQYIEQKYLLILARVPCEYEQGEFSLLLNSMRQQAAQKNKEIGIEKYLPEEVIQQVADLYIKQGHKVQKKMVLPLYQADLYIDDKIGIQFISVNEMLVVGDKFHHTGIQRYLQRKTQCKYIIYEEFVRSPDQLQYIKL